VSFHNSVFRIEWTDWLQGFQLLFGKHYTLFRVKSVFLSGLFLFEVGSLICGAAPNSLALIIGRAIASIGSSGLLTGAMMVIAHTIPLQKRPAYMGMTEVCTVSHLSLVRW
jgi:MFS family permease